MAGSRAALRSRWIERRLAFVTSPAGALAQASLRVHLQGVLATLEPDCLGVYWAIRGEFNAAGGIGVDTAPTGLPLALPFAQREGRVMHYRSWDGSLPTIEELDALPGISKKTAQRIIEHRPMGSIEDLNKIPGIGNKTLKKLETQVTW